MKFYCGIDLHARRSSLVVIDEKGEKVGQATVKNELAKVLAFLAQFEGEVTCVVESTYNWYWLVDGLQDHGYETKLAHAYGLHLITGSKYKSDLRDAHRLARLLRLEEIPLAYIYPADRRPLRDLMRRRIRLVKERGRLRSCVKNTLSRYNVKVDDANSERAIAGGVDLLPLPDEVKMDLSMTVEQIALLTSQIERMEARLTKITVADPRFRELMKIPGVGYVLALTIYYETGEVSRFPSGRNYASYCRLVASTSKSADKEKRGKGGKQGNPYLKWAFCQAAMGAARHDAHLAAFRDRHASRRGGKNANLLANCILAHKLCLAAYKILKDGCEFKKEMIGLEAGRGYVGHLTEENSVVL
jgi:transposase